MTWSLIDLTRDGSLSSKRWIQDNFPTSSLLAVLRESGIFSKRVTDSENEVRNGAMVTAGEWKEASAVWHLRCHPEF
ncbi:hypothetical protein EBAPG3_004815 [Nitrosospira lacus]|uniref:Uncharacterized protein n=1 Tax=Nitrosospira lacus TaxID=1288494 RepID=A0A1W6SMV9_9PROT|nr:hypothetical protein EBAPG3_004815 [Nitrosospira lacus]